MVVVPEFRRIENPTFSTESADFSLLREAENDPLQPVATGENRPPAASSLGLGDKLLRISPRHAHQKPRSRPLPAIQALAHDRDSFRFDTDDIATIDPDGYMQITERAKDVIQSGGE